MAVKLNNPTLKDIEAFRMKLHEEWLTFRSRRIYAKEHNFKEEERINKLKEDILAEMETKLSWVLDGSFRGQDIRLDFNT